MRRSLLVALLIATTGCYNYARVDTSTRAPGAGESVALDITDQGRVHLAERFGAGVTRIEGRVRAVPAGAYDLEVFKVAYVREGVSNWSGEAVRVDHAAVGSVWERRFSRGRTAVAATAVGGAIIAFVLTRTLVNSGRERDDPDIPTGPVMSWLARALHLSR